MLWIILLAVAAYIAHAVGCEIKCYKLDQEIKKQAKDIEDRFGK